MKSTLTVALGASTIAFALVHFGAERGGRAAAVVLCVALAAGALGMELAKVGRSDD